LNTIASGCRWCQHCSTEVEVQDTAKMLCFWNVVSIYDNAHTLPSLCCEMKRESIKETRVMKAQRQIRKLASGNLTLRQTRCASRLSQTEKSKPMILPRDLQNSSTMLCACVAPILRLADNAQWNPYAHFVPSPLMDQKFDAVLTRPGLWY